MKIRLYTHLNSPEHTYLNSTVILKSARARVPTNFIMDTGSTKTIINYDDARRLQLPFDNKADIIALGGRNYNGYIYKRLKMIFRTEDGGLVEEEMDVILLRPTSDKKMQLSPTIIGTDFLKEKGYKLFCDMAKDVAFLEKDSS